MQGAFSGTHAHIMDAKGRAIVPNAFRELLGERFTMRITDTSSAIAIYPNEVWEPIEQYLLKISPTDVIGQEYKRYVSANSYHDLELDGQGRVLLPIAFRARTRMNKKLLFVGMTDHFEIWDEDRYNAENDFDVKRLTELTKYVNQRYG